MDFFKKYSLISLKFLLFLILGSIINSIFYYYFFSKFIVNLISFIYIILVIFIFSYKNGKKINSKGLIVGLKLGLLFIFNLLILNILLNGFKFDLFLIFYYLILIFVSSIASIIGINKKKL